MVDNTKENGMNKFQLWMYKRAPRWIIKEDDPRGTVARMILVILVILSFVPFFGLLAFGYAGVFYF